MPDTATVPQEASRAVDAGRSRSRATRLASIALAIGAAVGGAVAHSLRVEPLPAQPVALLPQPFFRSDTLALTVPGYRPAAEVTSYKDELFAYLMFNYLRHTDSFEHGRLLLTYNSGGADTLYRLVFIGADDLLSGHAHLASLQANGVVDQDSIRLLPHSRISGFEKQTQLFDSAYNLPVRKKLDQLPRKALTSYLRRFIHFKSSTDPRVRRRLEPTPTPLSEAEAQRMAADIITVAEFYSLPLEYFVAIGAIENNYMNVRGDLEHSIWKRRAAPDDVVLEKKRGRVRVLNDSAGVWQITRETLRYAHSLYRKDERDYSALPAYLRPPEELHVEDVSPTVLTTYAGLLLRDLLDRFDGDVTLAVSAYNGGPARPNLRYGDHVHRAAEHARRVVESAAALNGETVVRITWLRSP